MTDIYKNPILYYIIVPVLAAIWPAFLFIHYLPAAQGKLISDINDYTDANNIMLDILLLSPERIESDDPNKEVIEFAYDRVVDEVATFCNIPATKCKLNAGSTIESKASKTQSASVRLSDIDITKFAKFLSTIQARWPKLVCDTVRLTKKENVPDGWEILIEFKYFYTASD